MGCCQDGDDGCSYGDDNSGGNCDGDVDGDAAVVAAEDDGDDSSGDQDAASVPAW